MLIQRHPTHGQSGTRRARARRVVRSAALGATTLLFAACGGDETRDPRAVAAVLPTHQASDAADEIARNAAEAIIIDGCVRQHDFDPPAPPSVADFSADVRAPTVKSTPYGPATVEDFMQAVAVGKNPGRFAGNKTPLAQADRRQTRYTGSLTVTEQERYTEVLWGDTNDPKANVELKGPGLDGGRAAIGGCAGVAYKTLYGDARRWAVTRELATTLPTEVKRRVTDSGEYRAALGRWRECVRGRGLPVKSIDTAGRLAVGQSQRNARRIAEIVIECRTSARLDEATSAKEKKVATELIATYEGEVLGYLEMRRRGSAKARTVLEQGARESQ